MTFHASDIVGFVGVSLIVGSYLMLTVGRMDASRPLYPALNGLGAALILFSLLFAFNAAAFAIEQANLLNRGVTGLIERQLVAVAIGVLGQEIGIKSVVFAMMLRFDLLQDGGLLPCADPSP